jgi:hypothetical protein
MADKSVRYAPEFKRQMVNLVRSGRTAASLSKEFGPTAWSIARIVQRIFRTLFSGGSAWMSGCCLLVNGVEQGFHRKVAPLAPAR